MKYNNPIIRGFNPDPSICRVGEDYYLVTSTFEYFPAIPVYHSKDLVNWTQIGNCIERPEQLPFEITKVDRGVWAPTIRYYNGKFYVTAKFMEFGNFIVSSSNPATGWSDPVCVDIGGIDPSILFEDGKAYYCTNHRGEAKQDTISLVEVNPDTGEMLSEIKPIWHGAAVVARQYLEAPHIYHVGDWYYVFAAEGGTGKEHMITVARSRDIWGPYETYENNPILTNYQREEKEVACSGHGDLFEDHNGNWWVVHLATRPDDAWYSHMGRESFLLPVEWKDEWPVIGDGVSHIECDGPLWNEQKFSVNWEADFNSIDVRWLFLRKPSEENYKLKDGHLFLKPSTNKISDTEGSPTFMAIRQPDIECQITVEMNFEPAKDLDEAGLTIYLSSQGYYSFSKRRENSRNYIVIAKNGDSFEPIKTEIPNGKISMRIEADKRKYDFYYSVDGGEYVLAGSVNVLTVADAGKCFTGSLIGLFAQCSSDTEAEAEICSFCVAEVM